MDEVRRILGAEIEQINRDEQRDNRIRFSRRFIVTHPVWFGAILVSDIPVALILWYAPYSACWCRRDRAWRWWYCQNDIGLMTGQQYEPDFPFFSVFPH
ncbi:YlaC family protein [Musicola keenii]|uniref:YlaC family protein n=1 Tax=Musicola keenii TaxID=2884250 RepID=UPI0022AA6F0B|nr:YlaC family protein [Musicola keenii]